MPDLQESEASSDRRASASGAPAAQGLGESTDQVIWGRVDWPKPVGHFTEFSSTPMVSVFDGQPVAWKLIKIRRFSLEHRAALLLLQGRPLNALLIPNQAVRIASRPDLPAIHGWAHVLLRVDPWQFWLPQPELTNIAFARLVDEIPAGVAPAVVLAELADRSSG